MEEGGPDDKVEECVARDNRRLVTLHAVVQPGLASSNPFFWQQVTTSNHANISQPQANKVITCSTQSPYIETSFFETWNRGDTEIRLILSYLCNPHLLRSQLQQPPTCTPQLAGRDRLLNMFKALYLTSLFQSLSYSSSVFSKSRFHQSRGNNASHRSAPD